MKNRVLNDEKDHKIINKLLRFEIGVVITLVSSVICFYNFNSFISFKVFVIGLILTILMGTLDLKSKANTEGTE